MPAMFFDAALLFVLGNEGGATFTNAVNDRGGPTKFGVTQATLASYRSSPQTADDVQNLRLSDVMELYRAMYWSPLHLDDVAQQPVATAMLDIAVLCGPGCSARLTQRTLNTITDGVIGPITLRLLNQAEPRAFLLQLSANLSAYFNGIIARDPTQAKWLPGWTTRSRRLTTLANTSAAT